MSKTSPCLYEYNETRGSSPYYKAKESKVITVTETQRDGKQNVLECSCLPPSKRIFRSANGVKVYSVCETPIVPDGTFKDGVSLGDVMDSLFPQVQYDVPIGNWARCFCIEDGKLCETDGDLAFFYKGRYVSDDPLVYNKTYNVEHDSTGNDNDIVEICFKSDLGEEEE